MVKNALAAAAIGMALIGTVHAQRSSRWEVMDDSVITRTLSFAPGGGRTLDVRNINGFIHVEATSDSTVQISVRKVIRAETQNDVAEAQREVQIEFTDNTARVGATVTEANRHVCGQEWEDDQGRQWRRRNYSVRFDFTIRVPRDTAIRLCTINGGDVIVNGTRGDFDVTNVNGDISMRDVAGSGRAHTVNGPVTVTLAANPKSASSFKTVNGNVDVTFQGGLDAEFAMKTLNGGLYTDFDVMPLASQAPAAGERRNGRFLYRVNQHTRVRVGGGGPEISFETLNGSVRARRAGGTAR
jgi:hypothetical protein